MEPNKDIAARLARIANELMQIAKQLEVAAEDEPVFPADAAKKVASGICLGGCGKTKAEEQFRRGNCPTCAKHIYDEIKRLGGQHAERAFIESGLLAPLHYGKKTTPAKEMTARIGQNLSQAQATKKADALAKQARRPRPPKDDSR